MFQAQTLEKLHLDKNATALIGNAVKTKWDQLSSFQIYIYNILV